MVVLKFQELYSFLPKCCLFYDALILFYKIVGGMTNSVDLDKEQSKTGLSHFKSEVLEYKIFGQLL